MAGKSALHRPSADGSELATSLLGWYDRARRDLPWRAAAGCRADPYRVWISEIMLQQTTAATVGPFYRAFLQRWPSVGDLAAADLDAVLHAWQGLGYYARARNLHACARLLVREQGGRLPDSEDALRRLPGVGAYTAAAIAAIAFERRATPIDGNVLRVVARLRGVTDPLPAGRARIEALARALTPERRCGDFAQAMMDLGATVCTPRRPACGDCAWQDACVAWAGGTPETLPRRSPKAAKPDRFGVVFWATRSDGTVLLRRRPEEGLLGGLMEFPSTPWRDQPWGLTEALALAPTTGSWFELAGEVIHTFTHFRLTLRVVTAEVRAEQGPIDGSWHKPDFFGALALPTLMKKVARMARAAAPTPLLGLQDPDRRTGASGRL